MPKQRELKNIYKSLKPYIRAVAQSTLIKPDFYDIALKAALAKTFDFNSYITGVRTSSHSFYHTATLRGICEDIIVLKAINPLPDKDRSDLVMHLQMKDVFESIYNQGRFFEVHRAAQIILSQKDADKHSQNEATRVKEIYKRHGFLENNRVTIKNLARRANLLEVYEFFYSATSKWVHFSPHVLMRMGWAPTKVPDAIYTYTTSHFSSYYAGFNAVYGTYLFGLFYELFSDELKIEPKSGKYIEELGLWIGSLSRWPELVTFEEMNINKPSLVLSELYRAAKKLSKID